MAKLIEDLLHLSKVTSGSLKATSVDLTNLARIVNQELVKREPYRRCHVVIQEGMMVVGDFGLLLSLMTNLLSNAWKYTSERELTQIEVGTQVNAEGDVVYFVKDNGAGFDSAAADKLFVPFQRLHHSTRFPGTGVGLATCKRIVTRHQGRIWAEAQPGEGATFFFTLGIRLEDPLDASELDIAA